MNRHERRARASWAVKNPEVIAEDIKHSEAEAQHLERQATIINGLAPQIRSALMADAALSDEAKSVALAAYKRVITSSMASRGMDDVVMDHLKEIVIDVLAEREEELLARIKGEVVARIDQFVEDVVRERMAALSAELKRRLGG
jgi:hypothetical protein